MVSFRSDIFRVFTHTRTHRYIRWMQLHILNASSRNHRTKSSPERLNQLIKLFSIYSFQWPYTEKSLVNALAMQNKDEEYKFNLKQMKQNIGRTLMRAKKKY